MKKIIKMFSAVILLVLINQNVFAQSCVSPCQALAGVDKYYCLTLCSNPPTLGASPAANPTSCGGSAVTYSWSPSSTLSCSTCPNPVCTPTGTTVYTLTVTFQGSCNCDASNCMQCTRTDQVTVFCTTCSHCKIYNPLFDPNVDNVCFIVSPPFILQPIDSNYSTELHENIIPNNLINESIQISEADKPQPKFNK